MASDELNSTNTPMAPGVALPPYPEMIMTAIEELGEINGSNKSSISKQIETTYPNLSPAHSNLLTHHLNRMKSSGQLVFLKNNYMKPDPNAPPRRGRGRPPKPKADLPAGIVTVTQPSRPRGRPPKVHDPNAPSSPAKPKPVNLSGRKRGRPPKASSSGGTAPAPKVQPVIGASPRGRGRPPKAKSAVAEVGA